MAVIPTIFTGPCDSCHHQVSCEAYTELAQYLFPRREFQRPSVLDAMDLALDELVNAFGSSLQSLRQQGRITEDQIGRSLSALFDLCVTAIYSNGLLAAEGAFSQQALRCGQDSLVFPYTWMCPLCVSGGRPRADSYLPGATRKTEGSVVRDFPNVKLLAKPGGRAIGDQGIKALKSILRFALARTDPTARLRDGGGARGEFDLTVATDSALVFIEVKAKPLIAYPLVAKFREPQRLGEPQHAWTDVKVADVQDLALFLGASGQRLSLEAPVREDLSTWPLKHVAAIVKSPEETFKIIHNWILQADAYAIWDNEPDVTRWHRFGCGNFSTIEEGRRIEKRVANTKELPGLDRTDDIKKGAAQVLKYSRLKFACKKSSLTSVLMGNTHAITHHNDYVAPLLRLKVANGDDESCNSEWIFDAVIGLTEDYINNPVLERLFNFKSAF